MIMLMHILAVAWIALMIGASLHDLAARTVPNRLALLLACIGLLAAAAGGHLAGSVIAAAVIFIIAALCWRRGWMGGGDVKLLGAAALSLPPVMVPTFIAAIALSGGVLALPYLLGRRIMTRGTTGRPDSLVARAMRAERWRIRRGGPLPYACAITAGAVFVFMQGMPS